MNQPFAFDEEGRAYINESEILKGQMIVSAAGISLPADFAEKAQEKADALERRLLKLEAEMERRNQADDEIRHHAVQMREFIESFSAADPK